MQKSGVALAPVSFYEGEHYQALPTSDYVGLKQWQEAKAMRERRLALAS